ncbi:Bestrophin, RFP-TM, chloride channel-domain-containing protein, partial [Naematelia encephala]
TMALPLTTLSSLLSMQEREDHKPRLSKISWLPDILVFRASILPTVLLPVLAVTLFSAMVAVASVWWGKDVGLTNNVGTSTCLHILKRAVPLLSVVVGLLLVFRNSSAYERYAEGRKDFTSLISNARNLSRLIWVVVCLPPTDTTSHPITRAQLTEEKKRLIRLIVAFVVATKHHLRAEGGVHHADLRGLLPPKLAGENIANLKRASASDLNSGYLSASPGPIKSNLSESPRSMSERDEESSVGLPTSRSDLSHFTGTDLSPHDQQNSATNRAFQHLRGPPKALKRRPTAVRIVVPDRDDHRATRHSSLGRKHGRQAIMTERTPLISAGVKPDLRKSLDDEAVMVRRAEKGLGRMVELGLPLIIRTIFKFRRVGYLETVGPAGVNAMQALVQGMTDQLGSMERPNSQTPMPYIIAVHMKQATTMLLFVLPFTLVDTLKAKMVPIMFFIALIYMGIEGIAAQVEQPFGTDPCDLNLDLYCTELLCECEAILERLPEGEEDEQDTFFRSAGQVAEDLQADDGGDDGCE